MVKPEIIKPGSAIRHLLTPLPYKRSLLVLRSGGVSMSTPVQKRKQVIRQAIANEKLEGLVVSAESRKLAENYVIGKVSAKAVAAKIRARYGKI